MTAIVYVPEDLFCPQCTCLLVRRDSFQFCHHCKSEWMIYKNKKDNPQKKITEYVTS